MYKSGDWYVIITLTLLYCDPPVGIGEMGNLELESQEVHTQLPLTLVPHWI